MSNRRISGRGKGSGNGSEALSLSAAAMPGHDLGSGATAGRSPASAALRTLSALADRLLVASHLGFQSHGGLRDIFVTFGYKDKLTISDYRDRYARGDIANRIINAPVKDTWKGGYEIIEVDDLEIVTKYERQCQSLYTRLKLPSKFARADRLAGLGRYSVILIGNQDVDLSEPLSRGGSPDQIQYLNVLAEDCAQIDTWEKTKNSPRYGLPLVYSITTGQIDSTGRVSGYSDSFKAHYSRIVHFIHDSLESDVYGEPELECIWNKLQDLDKVVGGGAETFWRRAKQILHIARDTDFEFDDEDEAVAELSQKIEDLVNGFSDTIDTEGIDLKLLSQPVEKFDSQVNSLISLIAGAKGYPKRRLLGSEQGELASSQDRENWKDVIDGRWADIAEPNLRQFYDRLIEYGYLVKPTLSDDGLGAYKVSRGSTIEKTDVEKADLATKMSDANSKQHSADGTIIYTRDEIRDIAWNMEALPKQEGEGLQEDDNEDQKDDNEDQKDDKDSGDSKGDTLDSGGN